RFNVDLAGRDGDRFGLFADLQHGVDPQGGVSVDTDVRPLLGLEPFELEQEVVATDRKLQQRVKPLRVGGHGERRAEGEVRGGYGDARYHASRSVLDRSGNTPADLRESRSRINECRPENE